MEEKTGMNIRRRIEFRADNFFTAGFIEIQALVDGRKPSVSVMRRRVVDLLKQAEFDGILDLIVRQVVLSSGLEAFLPESYTKFRAMVVEGMIFVLSGVPLPMLAKKIVDQIRLPASATLGRRMYTLLKDMPSLQKLGQVICRNPELDPQFKQSLVDLEDNIRSVTFGQVRPILAKEIKSYGAGWIVVPEKRILAEATVCAVIPAEVTLKKGRQAFQGVLKVVKPAVRRNMPEELALLDRLARFLDTHKKTWGLGEFNFQGTLDEVKRLLESEVDLVSEQRNLDVARTYYGSDATPVVPKRLRLSTPAMTAMSRINGTKITNVDHLTQRQRRRLAATLAKICILRPILDMRGQSIFHGDPHAGNLAYTFERTRFKIIFYDWSMLGRLGRIERFTLVLLILGLIMGNRKAVFYATDIITKGQISSSNAMRGATNRIIDEAIMSLRKRAKGVLSTIEFLFGKLTYQGIVFPADLMMYKKALITLRGVLADIDPSFNRDHYLRRAVLTTFLDDVVRLRLLKMVVKDIWSLYGHSLSLLIDIQKVVFWFVKDVVLRRLPEILSNKGDENPWESETS
jgi:ubiquinone biosynthesis protein